MLAALLLSPILALAQPSELIRIKRPVAPKFIQGKEAKTPTAADKKSVQKDATDWVKRRATATWKSSGFTFIGELHGTPADDLKRAEYSVYRMTFRQSPDVGRELQADMLFYAIGNELLWPPENWDRSKTPPGQMNAVIRTPTK